MITPKTKEEIEYMHQGGRKLGLILDELLISAQPGKTLLDIEKLACQRIGESGGTPSFMTVGDYKWATCLCVNDEVVHGIPTTRILRSGDVLTIDVGMIYKGLHTDTAYTKIIGTPDEIPDEHVVHFLETGKKALHKAISAAVAGKRVGDISHAIFSTVNENGCGIVKQLVGHGVGKILHEEPQIPGFVKSSIEKTPELVNGMTIAIEVIYAQGNGQVMYANDDGWTITTRDGTLSAVFEHTIVIADGMPIILTQRPSEYGDGNNAVIR